MTRLRNHRKGHKADSPQTGFSTRARGSTAARVAVAVLATALVVSVPLAVSEDETAAKQATTQPATRTASAVLHNLVFCDTGLINGSAPENERDLDAIAALGVKTIISVDSATPDVENAAQRGMRYVHLPFGYNGISPQRALEIARAVRDLPGPVYIHCHHGKHRSPTAAAMALVLLGRKTQAEMLQMMRDVGTSSRYTGLFAAVENAKTATPAEIDSASSAFPARAQPASLAAHMARLDRTWDHLKLIQAAGWKVPADQPDLDPRHEAKILAEQWRGIVALSDERLAEQEFRSRVQASEADAGELAALVTARSNTEADAVFRRLAQRCTDCHAGYRDTCALD